MTSRTASVTAAAAPLWTSFEDALRAAFRSLASEPGTVEALQGLASEQSRIRRTSRHWLVG